MKLRELLQIITNTAKDNDLPEVFIVGGTPRDKVLNLIRPGEISDLDITTGSSDIHSLAKSLSIDLSKQYHITTKQADDGHTSIIFPGNKFKLDCSSFFVIPFIDEFLQHKGIKNPTDLQRETYSRDFTCNTLLMTLDLKTIKDPTHRAMEDINKKILKTCLDPDTTLRYNTNRIIRIVYLAAKLDFDVDPEIIKWVSQHKNLVRLSSDSYLKKNIKKAMSKNPERAMNLINKMNIFEVLPVMDELRRFKKAQFVANFDLGKGLYENMDEYKSVSDFRKNKRIKRKKKLQKLKKK